MTLFNSGKNPQAATPKNSILNLFRTDQTAPFIWVISLEPDAIKPTFGEISDEWTKEQISHAQAVLTRLHIQNALKEERTYYGS